MDSSRVISERQPTAKASGNTGTGNSNDHVKELHQAAPRVDESVAVPISAERSQHLHPLPKTLPIATITSAVAHAATASGVSHVSDNRYRIPAYMPTT